MAPRNALRRRSMASPHQTERARLPDQGQSARASHSANAAASWPTNARRPPGHEPRHLKFSISTPTSDANDCDAEDRRIRKAQMRRREPGRHRSGIYDYTASAGTPLGDEEVMWRQSGRNGGVQHRPTSAAGRPVPAARGGRREVFPCCLPVAMAALPSCY